MREIDVFKLYELASNNAVKLDEELYRFSRLLYHNFELKTFFEDGSIPAEARKKMLVELHPDSSTLMRELIGLLIDQDLIRQLGWLAHHYSELISRKTGAPLVEITSAQVLPEDQKKEIMRFTEGRRRFEVDPAIIGGVRIKWEDGRYLDASLKGRLEALKEEILV